MLHEQFLAMDRQKRGAYRAINCLAIRVEGGSWMSRDGSDRINGERINGLVITYL